MTTATAIMDPQLNAPAALQRSGAGHQEKPLMPASAYEKTCTKCSKTKPLTDFGANRKMRDGRDSWCLACHCIATKEWQRANPERKAANKRRSFQRHPETKLEATRRERARHPEKYRARTALGHAVERGKITKPAACEGCGKEYKARLIHGHHRDYSKPLEVEWLCHGCHEAVHGGLKRSFEKKRRMA